VKTAIRENTDWGKDDNRGNENSNRQSDPDSTCGLERAEERHWYYFLFGVNVVTLAKNSPAHGS